MSIYGVFTVLYDSDNDGIPETDISADVVSSIRGENGSFSNDPTDFLANSGSASFNLDNSAGAYTTLPIGRRVDIKVSDGIFTKVVFSGKIAPSQIDPREWGDRQVHVSLDDWLKVASSNKAEGLQVQTNTRADTAMTTLLAPMARQPAHTDFETGIESFPDVFDGLSKNSNVYGEMDRIVKSELANCYLTFRDAAYGETLRLENQHSRGILTPLSTIPLNDASVGRLKHHETAGGNGLLKYHGAGGTSGYIRVSETQDAYLDRLHVDSDWQRGEGIVNRFTATDVSRRADTSAQVLFTYIGPSETADRSLWLWGTGHNVPFSGTYTDPNDRGTQINAKQVITPVATTDYLFNSEIDGSGTNLTANITILSFIYTATSWSCTVVNAGAPGYLTKFQVRGTGIYKNTNTDYIVENSQSIQDVIGEEREDTIRREYSVNRDTSKTFADGVVALRRLPFNNMRSASFEVSTEFLMRAFMFLDIGDKVRIVEGTPVKDGKFYIRGIKFALALGGLISFTWGLEEGIETLAQPIVVKAPVVDTVSAIDFGILPYLANLTEFSYSFWIRRDNALADTYFNILSKTVDTGTGRRGNEVITDGDGKIYLQSFKTPTDGQWITTSVVLTNAAQWYHVVITYDNTTDTANPVMYVDGSSVGVTETDAPSGTSDDDSDCPLVLFNSAPNPLNVGERYANASSGFALKNVRVYNRILTSSEVTTLAAAQNTYDNVPTGLLFMGIYAPSGFITEFTGDELSENDFVLDAVHKAAGIPYNADVLTDNKMLHGETP